MGDSHRNHIQTGDTVQFVEAFCCCSDILDSRIEHCGWTRFVPHADFDTEQLVSCPSIHIHFCGASNLIDVHRCAGHVECVPYHTMRGSFGHLRSELTQCVLLK